MLFFRNLILAALFQKDVFATTSLAQMTADLLDLCSIYLSGVERQQSFRLISKQFDRAFKSRNDEIITDIKDTELFFMRLARPHLSEWEIDEIIENIGILYDQNIYFLNHQYSLNFPFLINQWRHQNEGNDTTYKAK